MAAVGVAVLALGGGRAAVADPGVSETLTTSVDHAVSLHHGQVARIHYRADDTAGGAVRMDLVVTTRHGEVVRTLVRARETPVGVDLVWRGRVWLKAGRYVLVAHARDAIGRSEAQAVPASLTVRKALPPVVPAAAARRAAFSWAARRGAPGAWPSRSSTAAGGCSAITPECPS
jgi:hypothetical protein